MSSLFCFEFIFFPSSNTRVKFGTTVVIATQIKLQLNAARIVTGLPIFTKTDFVHISKLAGNHDIVDDKEEHSKMHKKSLKIPNG